MTGQPVTPAIDNLVLVGRRRRPAPIDDLVGRHRARPAADLPLVHPRGRPADPAAHRPDPRRRLPRRGRRDHRRGQQLPVQREPGRPAPPLHPRLGDGAELQPRVGRRLLLPHGDARAAGARLQHVERLAGAVEDARSGSDATGPAVRAYPLCSSTDDDTQESDSVMRSTQLITGALAVVATSGLIGLGAAPVAGPEPTRSTHRPGASSSSARGTLGGGKHVNATSTRTAPPATRSRSSSATATYGAAATTTRRRSATAGDVRATVRLGRHAAPSSRAPAQGHPTRSRTSDEAVEDAGQHDRPSTASIVAWPTDRHLPWPRASYRHRSVSGRQRRNLGIPHPHAGAQGVGERRPWRPSGRPRQRGGPRSGSRRPLGGWGSPQA